MANALPTTQFFGKIEGRNIIAAPHYEPGVTINYCFGHHPDQNEPARPPSEPFSNVPFRRDPDYVNRPHLLAWIQERCARPAARAALVGFGGVGKSQLAIQYCHDVRDASPQTWVFWVHASTQARFEEAYKNIADRLKLPRWNDPSVDTLKLVYNWLSDEKQGRWLMVLDNVDDVSIFHSPRKLASYLPQSHNGSILVTSRNKDAAARLVGGYRDIQEVQVMSEPQAMQLLCTKLNESADKEESAATLLRELNYIPLAITQAAAYINRGAPRTTITSYLQAFRRNNQNKESLLIKDTGDLRRDDSASNSVIITWQMSFEQIRGERRSAADLLSLMSFFNPQGIPEDILRHGREHTPWPDEERIADEGVDDDEEEEEEEEEEKDKEQFDEDIDLLRAYSLIAATAEHSAYEMHRLVQFCTQVWLRTSNEFDRWKRRFLGTMAEEFPSGEFETWTKCQQLLPHVTSLLREEPRDEELVEDWAQVLNNVACYLSRMGRHGSAEEFARKAMMARKRRRGCDDEHTLVSMSMLTSVLRGQGKYREAEEMQREALERYKRVLGEEHLDTLISMDNLALVLQDQGKYKEAEEMQRKTLERYKRVLGEEHLDTLLSMNNLASTLHCQGKYKEAEELQVKVKHLRTYILGPCHPDTLWTMCTLAFTWRYSGRKTSAMLLLKKCAEKQNKILGSTHPDSVFSVKALVEWGEE